MDGDAGLASDHRAKSAELLPKYACDGISTLATEHDADLNEESRENCEDETYLT